MRHQPLHRVAQHDDDVAEVAIPRGHVPDRALSPFQEAARVAAAAQLRVLDDVRHLPGLPVVAGEPFGRRLPVGEQLVGDVLGARRAGVRVERERKALPALGNLRSQSTRRAVREREKRGSARRGREPHVHPSERRGARASWLESALRRRRGGTSSEEREHPFCLLTAVEDADDDGNEE